MYDVKEDQGLTAGGLPVNIEEAECSEAMAGLEDTGINGHG